MKILILTPEIPYPLTEGGYVSQFATIDALQKAAEIILVLKIENENDNIRFNKLVGLLPKVKFEILNLISESKEKDSVSILNILRKWKRSVKKLLENKPETGKENAQLVTDFDSFYIPHFVKLKSRGFTSKVVEIVEKHKPDVVQIDMLAYVDLAFLLPQHIKKVFVHHEIRFARLLSSFAILKDKSNPFYEEYLIREIREREKAYLRAYDGIIVFSENDRDILLKELPENSVHSSPFPILENHFAVISKKNTEVAKLVFIGGEGHDPNRDAIDWYTNELDEAIRKKNTFNLYIIGNWSKTTIYKCKDMPNLIFEGVVEDLIEFCKNSILIVPVRVGSGIRTKILYAMAQGVPVVSTSLGCEGIEVTDMHEIMIANTPSEFSNAIDKITNDIELGYNLALNAQNFVRTKYSQSIVAIERLNYFNKIIGN